MKRIQQSAWAVLLIITTMSLFADVIAPAHYATQFRGIPNAVPSRQHWLGTDDLGRDRFSRLVYGTRVSLLLAPAAALFSTAIAALIGGVAGFLGGWWQRVATGIINLVLSLPWLFLLILARAMLPLNTAPFVSVAITFGLLGLLGWAASARVLCAGAESLRNSEFILMARSAGISNWRLITVHILPNLKPALMAQFWISIPAFILSEANLGILGLGVSEPLPSWGSLLRELEGLSGFASETWKLMPLVLLVVVVSSFQLILTSDEGIS